MSPEPGLGTFEPKNSIPKDDRLDNYKLQWEREPKIQTFPRASSYTGYDDPGFMVTRKREKVVDPENQMREEINSAARVIVTILAAYLVAVQVVQYFSNKQDEEELNEIQRRKQH